MPMPKFRVVRALELPSRQGGVVTSLAAAGTATGTATGIATATATGIATGIATAPPSPPRATAAVTLNTDNHGLVDRPSTSRHEPWVIRSGAKYKMAHSRLKRVFEARTSTTTPEAMALTSAHARDDTPASVASRNVTDSDTIQIMQDQIRGLQEAVAEFRDQLQTLLQDNTTLIQVKEKLITEVIALRDDIESLKVQQREQANHRLQANRTIQPPSEQVQYQEQPPLYEQRLAERNGPGLDNVDDNADDDDDESFLDDDSLSQTDDSIDELEDGDTSSMESIAHSHRSQGSPESLVGRHFAKYFDQGIFFGLVLDYTYDPADSRWFRIVYDDGDREDVNLEQVHAGIQLYQRFQTNQKCFGTMGVAYKRAWITERGRKPTSVAAQAAALNGSDRLSRLGFSDPGYPCLVLDARQAPPHIRAQWHQRDLKKPETLLVYYYGHSSGACYGFITPNRFMVYRDANLLLQHNAWTTRTKHASTRSWSERSRQEVQEDCAKPKLERQRGSTA